MSLFISKRFFFSFINLYLFPRYIFLGLQRLLFILQYSWRPSCQTALQLGQVCFVTSGAPHPKQKRLSSSRSGHSPNRCSSPQFQHPTLRASWICGGVLSLCGCGAGRGFTTRRVRGRKPWGMRSGSTPPSGRNRRNSIRCSKGTPLLRARLRLRLCSSSSRPLRGAARERDLWLTPARPSGGDPGSFACPGFSWCVASNCFPRPRPGARPPRTTWALSCPGDWAGCLRGCWPDSSHGTPPRPRGRLIRYWLICGGT